MGSGVRLLICVAVILSVSTMLACGVVSAQSVSYVVENDVRVPTPHSYIYERQISEIGLVGASDLFLLHDSLYIADTVNNRIVEVGTDGDWLREIGRDAGLKRPEGVFVSENGDIYVADTGNSRIMVFGPDGQLMSEFYASDTEQLGSEFVFQPSKLVVDRSGMIYVVSKGDYRGLLRIDSKGNFRGIFGDNRVGFSLTRILLRRFATEQQYARLAQALPPPHSNLFLSDDGLIYSSTQYQTENQIKKLNAIGEDVLNNRNALFSRNTGFYGETVRDGWEVSYPRFVDVSVDQEEMIYAVDLNLCLVYKYDYDGNMIAVFGGWGYGEGLFTSPSSIVVDASGRVYVLDRDKNSIQVFRPTTYGRLVQEASSLYQQGRYQEAAEPWRKVLEMNSILGLANAGIAKAAYGQRDYATAMEYFQYAEDRDGYSRAFAKYRYQYITSHFNYVVLGLLVAVSVVCGVYAIGKHMVRKPQEQSGFLSRLLQKFVPITVSPTDGFAVIKDQGTAYEAAAIVILVIMLRLISLQFTSFQMEKISKDQINVLAEVVKVVLCWGLFSLANFGVSTISEGEGHLREIVIASAYCLVPYILTIVPVTLLTHLVGTESRGFFSAVEFSLALWIGYLLFNMIRVIHDFDLGKAVKISLTTLGGVVSLLVVSGLGYGFLSKLFYFIQEILVETSIR